MDLTTQNLASLNKNKPLIAVLAGIIIVLLIALIIAASYKIGGRKGADQSSEPAKIEAASPFPGFPNGTITNGAEQGEKVIISEKEKLPDIMSGKIASVTGDKITVKQFASIDLNYEIGKGNVASITVLKKNSGFDEKKAEEMREKLAQKLKETDSNKNSNLQTPPAAEEIGKEAAGDPSLKMLNESKGGWSDLKEGIQISVTLDKDKKAEIIVYPEDFPMGPPATGLEKKQEEPIILDKM